MKLAVVFPASLFSAWACSYGLVNTLKRMGHEVTPIGVDPQTGKCSSFKVPVEADAYIISGPEHIGKFFPRLPLPTVAWLHESVIREDYGKLDVDAIKRNADIVFCPAIQDEQYGFRYLPFGVDIEVFKPALTQKTIDAGFIGLLYPKRQDFLAKLKKHGVNLTTGNVQVLELGGVNPQKTAELYAENLRKIKVFVNLPTLSQLAVTKIYEAAACGTFILTPQLADIRNFPDLYTSNLYDPSDPLSLSQVITTNIADEKSREDCAARLSKKVIAQDRLELRCEKLIAALKEAA